MSHRKRRQHFFSVLPPIRSCLPKTVWPFILRCAKLEFPPNFTFSKLLRMVWDSISPIRLWESGERCCCIGCGKEKFCRIRLPAQGAASMKITRREAIGVLAGAVPALRGSAHFAVQSTPQAQIIAGPFQPTTKSLSTYQVPEWFRDAKFGIWAHWGPQSSVEAGDWYARRMYIEGEEQYKYHLDHYGHPSKFGYKDLIPLWKGAEFHPDYLMGLYKKAGAKYFMSMGVHHDNFDLWNSRHNEWNAVNMGIKKDVVGLWSKAAREHGLKFGVSDHLWISYKWFAPSHLADKSGSQAGVAYDGADPKYAGLYHKIEDPKLLTAKLDWNEEGIPETWKEHWFHRIKDLVDQYHPDVLYSDGHLPFQDWGLRLLANHYNLSAKNNRGAVEAIYGTRPWKISGQTAPAAPAATDASFNESKRRAFTADDVRFTKKGETLYAFVMGWPEKQAVIAALASDSKQAPGKIENVELLGHSGKLKWTRDEGGLKIALPEEKPCEHAVAFRIAGAGLV